MFFNYLSNSINIINSPYIFMSIYEGSVRRPIMTTLVFVAIAIFGLFSLSKLPIDLMPDIETNTIMVMETYPGASAEDIENNVTRPLENVLNSVNYLKQLWYARTIKRLMHQFIDGLVPEDDTLKEMLKLCRKGTTKDDILEVLDKLCGNLPLDRMQALVKLRKKYKIYLLSNINGFLWNKSVRQIRDISIQEIMGYWIKVNQVKLVLIR